jgi:hypothetical protein
MPQMVRSHAQNVFGVTPKTAGKSPAFAQTTDSSEFLVKN